MDVGKVVGNEDKFRFEFFDLHQRLLWLSLAS